MKKPRAKLIRSYSKILVKNSKILFKFYDFKGDKIILLPLIVGCCSKKSNSDLS